MAFEIFRLVKDVPRLRKARRSIERGDFAEALMHLRLISMGYPVRPLSLGMMAYCYVAEGYSEEALGCIEELRSWSSDEQCFGDYADHLVAVLQSDRLRYMASVPKYWDASTGLTKKYLPLFDFSGDKLNKLGLKSQGSSTGSFPRSVARGQSTSAFHPKQTFSSPVRR